MLILAMDTSGDTCSIALADARGLRAEHTFRHDRRLTERLPGIVHFVLADSGLTLGQVDAFAVGVGPGSFTGVRVGVTIAKVWAETLGRPVVGVSSLDAMAATRLDRVRIAVAPSRKDEVIAAFYRAGERAPFEGPRVVPTADLPTDGVPILGEVPGAATEAAFPRAAEIAALALPRLLRGEGDDPATLAPQYVSPPPIRGALAP